MDREENIPVDATLEGDIDDVEQAVARYLGDATARLPRRVVGGSGASR